MQKKEIRTNRAPRNISFLQVFVDIINQYQLEYGVSFSAAVQTLLTDKILEYAQKYGFDLTKEECAKLIAKIK